MDLPPGARVVEFGPGWGFTSLWLAKLGHKVTVVEIDPAFCALLARRAAQEGVEIEIVNDDFMWIARAGRQFDAAVFFECFHHCADHLGLLAALADAVAPEGALYFAAEPITADFPMPWGLRLDGNSLWAIRKNGWLELGFREDYFAAALRHTGWVGQRLSCGDHGMMVVWQARRRAALRIRLAGDDPALRSEIGTRAGAALLLEGQRAGTGLFGPYVDLPAGGYLARIHFAAPVAGKAVMDVCAEGGARVLARQQVEARTLRDDNTAELAFHAADDLRGMEVRLFCDRGFRARIGSVEIIPHDAA
jgi:hypothetical protein